MIRTFTSALCVLVGLCGAAVAQSDVLAVKDVPAAATEAAGKAAPGIDWLLARKVVEMDKDKKVDTYRLIGKEKVGKKRAVAFLSRGDGTGGFVRIEVALKDVPEAITRALKEKHPTFKILFAQASGLSTDKITAYRVIGERGSVDATYVVSLDGKRIIRE
jgi:hypothetical protein